MKTVRVVGNKEMDLLVDDKYWLKKINDLVVDKFSNARLVKSCLQVINIWLMEDKTLKMQLDSKILDIFIKL